MAPPVRPDSIHPVPQGNPAQRYRQMIAKTDEQERASNPAAEYRRMMNVRPDSTHTIEPPAPAEEEFSFQQHRLTQDEKNKQYKEVVRGLLQRRDLTPERRARLQKWMADSGNFFENTNTEDRMWIENVGRGVMDGFAMTGYGAADLALGVMQMPFEVVDKVMGGQGLVPFQGMREYLHEGMAESKTYFDPQGKAGVAGQAVGVFAGGVPVYGPVNAVALRAALPALARVSPRLANTVRVGLAPGASFGQRIVSEAIASGSVDIAQAADIVLNDDLFPTWEAKAKALGLTAGASAAGAVVGAALPRRARLGDEKADPELLNVEQALDRARQPTTADVERLTAEAQKKLVVRDRRIAGKAVHEWNRLTPEQRREAYPELADHADKKFGELPGTAKAAMRNKVTPLIDEQLGVADAKTRIDELKQRAIDIAQRARKLLSDERAERRKYQDLAMKSEKVPSLGNYRAFTGMIDRLRRGGTLENHEFVFLDLRALKEVNDFLGHAEGDARLNKTGLAMIKAAADMGLDPRDTFHVSGDEFLAVMPSGRGKEFLDRVQAEFGEMEIAPGLKRKSSVDGAVAKTLDDVDKALSNLKINRKPEEQRIGSDTNLDTSQSTAREGGVPTAPRGGSEQGGRADAAGKQGGDGQRPARSVEAEKEAQRRIKEIDNVFKLYTRRHKDPNKVPEAEANEMNALLQEREALLQGHTPEGAKKLADHARKGHNFTGEANRESAIYNRPIKDPRDALDGFLVEDVYSPMELDEHGFPVLIGREGDIITEEMLKQFEYQGLEPRTTKGRISWGPSKPKAKPKSDAERQAEQKADLDKVRKITKRVGELNGEHSTLMEELNAIEKQLDSVEKDPKLSADEKQKQYNKLGQDVLNLRSKREAIEEEVSGLQKQFEQLKEKYADLLGGGGPPPKSPTGKLKINTERKPFEHKGSIDEVNEIFAMVREFLYNPDAITSADRADLQRLAKDLGFTDQEIEIISRGDIPEGVIDRALSQSSRIQISRQIERIAQSIELTRDGIEREKAAGRDTRMMEEAVKYMEKVSDALDRHIYKDISDREVNALKPLRRKYSGADDKTLFIILSRKKRNLEKLMRSDKATEEEKNEYFDLMAQWTILARRMGDDTIEPPPLSPSNTRALYNSMDPVERMEVFGLSDDWEKLSISDRMRVTKMLSEPVEDLDADGFGQESDDVWRGKADDDEEIQRRANDLLNSLPKPPNFEIGEQTILDVVQLGEAMDRFDFELVRDVKSPETGEVIAKAGQPIDDALYDRLIDAGFGVADELFVRVKKKADDPGFQALEALIAETMTTPETQKQLGLAIDDLARRHKDKKIDDDTYNRMRLALGEVLEHRFGGGPEPSESSKLWAKRAADLVGRDIHGVSDFVEGPAPDGSPPRQDARDGKTTLPSGHRFNPKDKRSIKRALTRARREEKHDDVEVLEKALDDLDPPDAAGPSQTSNPAGPTPPTPGTQPGTPTTPRAEGTPPKGTKGKAKDVGPNLKKLSVRELNRYAEALWRSEDVDKERLAQKRQELNAEFERRDLDPAGYRRRIVTHAVEGAIGYRSKDGKRSMFFRDGQWHYSEEGMEPAVITNLTMQQAFNRVRGLSSEAYRLLPLEVEGKAEGKLEGDFPSRVIQETAQDVAHIGNAIENGDVQALINHESSIVLNERTAGWLAQETGFQADDFIGKTVTEARAILRRHFGESKYDEAVAKSSIGRDPSTYAKGYKPPKPYEATELDRVYDEIDQIAAELEQQRMASMDGSNDPAKTAELRRRLEPLQARAQMLENIKQLPFIKNLELREALDRKMALKQFDEEFDAMIEEAAKRFGNKGKSSAKTEKLGQQLDKAMALLNKWKDQGEDAPGLAQLEDQVAQIGREYMDSWRADVAKAKESANKPKTTQELLDDLDVAEDKLDKKLEKGQITDEEYGAQWSRIGEARAELKRRLAAETVQRRQGTPPAEPKRPEKMRYPLLTKSEDELRGALEEAKTIADATAQLAVVEQIRQALRVKKPVSEFDHAGLTAHDREIRAMLQESSEIERPYLADRLAEVRNELAKRRGPNLGDFLGDESGAVEFSPNSWWDDNSTLTAAERETMDHVVVAHGIDPGWRKAVKNLVEDPTATVQELFYNFRRSIERSILPLENVGMQTAQWAQLFSGWSVRAEQWLFNRPFLWTTEGNVQFLDVRPLAAIVGGFKSRTNKLRAYLYAARSLEVGADKSGLDDVTATRVVENADSDIKAAAAEASRFADATLLYAVDAGLVRGKLAETLIKLYKAYAPLHRVLEGEEIVIHNGKMVGVRVRPSTITGPRKVIYKLTGGKAKIVDPIQALTENTRRIIRESDLNRIGLSILKKVREDPESMRGIAEIDQQSSVIFGGKSKKVFDEMKKLAKAEGIEADDEVLKDLTLMLSRERLGKKNDKLVVYEDGKRIILRVAPDIAEAIGSLSPEAASWWVQMISIPTRTLKAGIVLQPLFPPLAAMKDALEATIRSKYGFKPWDSLRGFGIAISSTRVAKMLGISESQYLREFRAGGGAFAALSGIEARSDKAAYRYVLNKGRNAPLLHPVDALRRYARPFEEAARLGEFRRARMHGRSVLEASIAARNIAIDFSQAGGSMQALNMMVPFLNPAIQGIATDMRALKQNPKQVIAVGSALALATWALMAANEGDQEISDLRKTPYGSLFLWFRLPNGEIAKLPKPYFWGQVFMTGAEQAYDRVKHDDPDAAGRWAEALQNAMWGVGLPALGQWYVGAKYNREPFTGVPVVPGDLEGIEDMYQIRPNTSPIGRKVGEMLEVSPLQVDYAIRSAFGSLGRDVLSAFSIIDRARSRAPEPVAADMPVIGRLFSRYPAGLVQPVYKFYDDAREVEEVMNTISHLGREQPSKVAGYITRHIPEMTIAEVYSGARQSMAEIRAAMDAINSIKEMDPKEKREYNDMYLKTIIELARQANETARIVKNATAQGGTTATAPQSTAGDSRAMPLR